MIFWRKRMFGTDYDIGCSKWKVATKRQNATSNDIFWYELIHVNSLIINDMLLEKHLNTRFSKVNIDDWERIYDIRKWSHANHENNCKRENHSEFDLKEISWRHTLISFNENMLTWRILNLFAITYGTNRKCNNDSTYSLTFALSKEIFVDLF
jgi:hypothetical protein